jgi:Raf kinase inhibitor-like YbhB/YbcL family protein
MHNRAFQKPFVPLLLLTFGLLYLYSSAAWSANGKEKRAMDITLTSPSFAHMGTIPAKHTCEGADLSPALGWTNVPKEAKSLVLIVDDPDAPDPKAPRMTWVHWILYNIPPDSSGLPEAVTAKDLPQGTLEGMSDFKRTGYGGPCPPIGRHRYFFKLYALDTLLPDLKAPKKADLLGAMEGHILTRHELIGTYEKGKK